MQKTVVAAIQAAPVYFDRDASAAKACRLIEEAASRGAKLAAFGETWLPGYPGFAWRSSSEPHWWEASALYIEQAVEIPGPITDQLCAAARRCGIDVVIGVVELDRNTQGTVYATLLFIGSDGRILGRHRKLKPSAYERVAWSQGDVAGLLTHERSYGRISGLNCWEHNMMLPGYALAAQGTQIHVVAWPGREPKPPQAPNAQWPRQHLLSRAFAAQAACYVICAGGLLEPEHMPAPLRSLVNFRYTGDSAIIDPRGEIIALAESGKEVILTAEIDLLNVRAAKSVNDIAGHYARPDIFQLTVNTGTPDPMTLVRPVDAAAGRASGIGSHEMRNVPQGTPLPSQAAPIGLAQD
jgi:predicted amidohydrolase